MADSVGVRTPGGVHRLGRWIAEIPKLVVALLLLAAIADLLIGVFLR